ncbi:hexosaminidase D-like isoform X1 [Cimex lectularius]|uniref:beta-N-acetylhexosaminidase n=1 Tax=Cimex lectularius TaxID=79782 RepID=A0A8I6SQX6_CIMLE|nr:hexosaminidase D-like isoform X1 [Cimex lectularius]
MWRKHRRCLLLVILFMTLVLVFLIVKDIHIDSTTDRRRFLEENGMLRATIKPEFNKAVFVTGFNTETQRVVHLDLKGAPPRLSYLKVLLPALAAHGCDTLLIEYEDMFPYTGKIVNISARNSYTIKEVRELLTQAHDLGLEVIPLVQTFGHLEHVLKLKDWSHLREVPPYPQAICPSNPDSFLLIQEMISQVMAFHVGARYIHIGADEVFHLGICPLCVRSNINPTHLFINHVLKIAQYITEKYPNVKPIIWDDMMRSWSKETLKNSKLSDTIEPMVWVYSRNVFETLRYPQWRTYLDVFPKLWVAGAFKGASKPTSVFPDLMTRYENQRSWLGAFKTLNDKSHPQIVGYVLTGWSRHDHFSVLCEILPASLPSLFLNLAVIKEPDSEKSILLKKWGKALSCASTQAANLDALPDVPEFLWYCSFPGSDLFKLLIQLSILKSNVATIEKTITQNQGWMTDYNVRHNFTSPWRIIEDYTRLRVFPTLNNLNIIRKNITTTMNKYFDFYSTNEFLQQKVLPLQNTLLNLSKTLDRLIVKTTWPRRPLS